MALDKILPLPQEDRSNPVCTNWDLVKWDVSGEHTLHLELGCSQTKGELVLKGFKQKIGDSSTDLTDGGGN